jgi:hypothetical protein
MLLRAVLRYVAPALCSCREMQMASSRFHFFHGYAHAAWPIVLLLCLTCRGAVAQTAAPVKKAPQGQAQLKQKAPVQAHKRAADKPVAAAAAATTASKTVVQKPVPSAAAKAGAAAPTITPAAGGGSTDATSPSAPRVVAPAIVAAPVIAASAPWSLPALSAVKAAAPVWRSAGTAASATQRGELTLSVLQRHGFRGADIGGLRQGLPSALLNNPLRSQLLLNELRDLDRSGEWTTMSRRLPPQNNDQDTDKALAQLASSGEIAALTGSDALTDSARRKAASEQCRRATVALDRHELRLRGMTLTDPSIAPGSAPFWSAVEAQDKPALDQYRQAAGVYTQACLDTQWLSLTDAQRAAMRDVVGHVLLDGVHTCMGARIAKERFLTARHCLYRYDEALSQWLPRRIGQRQVALIGDAATRFEATELDCSAAPADAACAVLNDNPVAADQIVLKVAARSQDTRAVALPPMPALRVERPALRQFLVVPGHSAWITGRAWKPADAVYVTTAGVPGCMVAEIANGCVVNACQSEAGFSGAPMFARRNVNELVMVGIFLGSANEYEQCKRADRNFGALPPQHVLAGVR